MAKLLSTLVPAALALLIAPRPSPAGPAKKAPAATEIPACSGVGDLATGAGGSALRSGERLEYELTLGGAYMGRMELSVGEQRRVEGKVAVPLSGRLRTTALVDAVKAIEGRYMAMVDPSTLSPFGVRVQATVGEDRRWEEVSFLDGGRRAKTRFLFQGQEAERAYGATHPLMDGLSLLHVARSVRLEPGLVACQDILSTRRLWRMTAQVIGAESIDTPTGRKRAFRVRTTFAHWVGRRPTTKPIAMDILIGDLPGRPPLAFEMTQSQFHGRASLVRWDPGRAPNRPGNPG